MAAQPDQPSPDTGGHGALPAPLARLIGRERDLARVIELLGATRLLTLTGSGGAGKTRLALAAARALAPALADGAAWVELAPLADPALVPLAVAAAVGAREAPGRPLPDALLAALRDRRLLLVLDNAEHLVDAVARLAEALLAGCPRLTLLVTSREALAIAAEVAWRVPSLATPAPGALPPPAALAAVPAVALFLDRARAARPDFALTDRNAAAVAEVCRRLDGLPLAIELAAARAPVLTAEQIAARLDDRFRLLTGGGRTAPPRQQTLGATLDWSHDLLTAEEQVLFRRLAVFAGGWPLEAAEAVGVGDVGEAPAVLDRLTRLVGQSLVQAEEGAGGAMRYRLLETVRQYGQERLRAAGDEGATRERHAAWCLALAEAAEPALASGEQVRWLPRLAAEHDNFRAALAWWRDADPAAGLRLAASLWQYWRARAHHREGRRWLEELVGRAPAPTAERARALLGLGILVSEWGDAAGARPWLEASLALSRRLGDRWLINWSLRDLAAVLENLGEFGASRTLLEEAGAVARAIGDRRGLADSLQLLGRQVALAGDYREAQRLLEEALGLLRAGGDRTLVCQALFHLSEIALNEGRDARAQELAQEGLTVAREVGSPYYVSSLRDKLGRIALWRGDLAQARAQLEAVLAEARDEPRNAYARGVALARLGQVARLDGEVERALALARESVELFTALESPRNLGHARYVLGLAEWSRGEAATATTCLRESLRLRRQLGDRLGMAECLEGLALVAAGPSRRPAGARTAARLLGAAEAARAAIGAPLPPVDRPQHAAAAQAARDAVGEDAVAVAWAAGRALPLERGVAEALAEADEAPAPAAAPAPRDPDALTRREAEVLGLLAEGATDAAIAGALSISVNTVHRHVASILAKTGAANRTAAAAALRRGRP